MPSEASSGPPRKWCSSSTPLIMTLKRSAMHRAALVALLTVPLALPLKAQNAASVPPANCRGTVPAPFARVIPPTVVVRIMAEGEFPDADIAAARALIQLTRDALAERGPAALQSRISVARAVAPSLSAVADMRGLDSSSTLLTAIVLRTRDSVTILWRLRTVGDRVAQARSARVIVPVQELSRGALVLAELAARATGAPSLGAPPDGLPSADAGNTYVVGLAEALNPSPSSLTRARNLLVRATTLAPDRAEVWRWRARVELLLIDLNTSSDATGLRGLRASALASAARAAQLAPRSNGALVALAEAYLGSGDREKAAAVLADLATRDANNPAMQRVSALLHRMRGNDVRALEQLRAAVGRDPRDASLLVDLASLARLRGDAVLACHSLNAAVVADAELASSYALRALVRAGLGELREAWADAEIATRLGHPEWGERAAAVLDVKYAERSNAVNRLRSLGGTSATPSNYLDALLLAQASAALATPAVPARVASGLTCKSPLRPMLLRDLKVVGVTVSDSCAPAAKT